jgi:hypothetical protein
MTEAAVDGTGDGRRRRGDKLGRPEASSARLLDEAATTVTAGPLTTDAGAAAKGSEYGRYRRRGEHFARLVTSTPSVAARTVAPVDGDDDTAMTSEPEEMSMTLAAVSSCWLPPLEQPKDSVMLHAMAAGWDGRMG